MSAPLGGLLVADFSRVLAGPMATMMLADLGARVIKVERPGVGDETRAWGPPFTTHASSYYEAVNRSKESLTLDLTDPRDRVLARKLALRADVLVENFLPGTMERFGLGYATLAEVNPGLVYCSVTGFGSEAGMSRPGYDFLIQAVGGLMSITGPPEQPSKVGVAMIDVLTGKDAVIGILAALNARARTGRGDHVEVALLMSSLAGLVNQAQSTLATGVAPRSLGNEHPSIAPYETLRCADGHLAIACGNDRQFARLTTELGVAHLASDPAFRTNADRVTNRRQLAHALEAALAADSAQSWARRLTEAGVPAGLVGSVVDGLALAEEVGLDPTIAVGPEHDRQIRHPIRWRNQDPSEPTPPPDLGAHTAALREGLASTPDRGGPPIG